MEFATGNNGSLEIPHKVVEDDDGYEWVYPSVPISEIHEECKRGVKRQIDYGIAAEQNDFDMVWFTEHRFQITGKEYSPNPLMNLMYVAAKTERIKLLQLANIITWHDPVRLAEQTAMLDNASDGRAEVGIGRGYIPREAEVMGQYWGGTVQDQQMNRKSFEEKYEIMVKAWTEDMFTHKGEFHTIPPGHTEHNYDLDLMYLEDDVTDHHPEDVVDFGEDQDQDPTLKSLSVFPQPLQEPHPQIWQPTLSDQSIRWAARRGINVYSVTGTTEDVTHTIETYHKAAEEAGWPDHRPEYDGQPLRRGWDAERGRGVVTRKFVFNTEIADQDTIDRMEKGLEGATNHYVALGFFPPDVAQERFGAGGGARVTGDSEEIIEQLCEVKEEAGYEDFILSVDFTGIFLTEEERLEQMEAFSEEVMPYMREEYPEPDGSLRPTPPNA